MAAGMAADYFSQMRPPVRSEHRSHYFEYVREHDLALTHALTNPQVDRSQVGDASSTIRSSPSASSARPSDGIIVRGARMLATLPISDEILIFPSTVLKGGDDMKPYALAFAIPNDTPGLSFQCREPLDLGRSHADHPLGSRFDEMDAMVVLRRRARAVGARVPDERRRPRQPAYAKTGAVLHMAHQVVNLKIAKTEAFLGRHAGGRRHDRHRRLPARAGDGRRGRSSCSRS